MSNTQLTTKQFFQREDVKAKFNELLGTRTNQFMTSLLSIVNNNSYLKNASPESIYSAAMMAAALDLPINPNLGFAYIIPYGQQAQFQVSYRGLIQLCLRSGQFKTISVSPVYEGQLIENNPLTGYKFDFNVKASDKVIGYCSYFSLINGFEKSLYMTVDEITAHGKKYSKTFGNGVWKNDFNAMAQKTCLKLLLSKYAPMSIEMQKAVIADQAVIKDVDTMEVDYVDAGQDVSIKIEEVTQNATARIDKLKNKTND
ncbi:MAG: recombinase RecT [Flavobacterium sp.]|jgi:recombination protein RecT